MNQNNKKISTDFLAAIIIDIMLDCNIVDKKSIEDAIKKASEEIDIQKKNQKYYSISSEELAEKIADKLISNNLLSDKNRNQAIEIGIEEIDVRKAAGDY